MNHIKSVVILVVAFGLLSFSGCVGGNSDVAEVTGTISIDGKPVKAAVVSFYPVQGRASLGITDEEGGYTLTYVRNQEGALIGEHKVTVKTRINKGGGYGEDDGEANEPRKEMLPKKYTLRKTTELTATVEPGSNKFDFDLESK